MIKVNYDGAEKKLTLEVDVAAMVERCRHAPGQERDCLVNLRGNISLLIDELEGTFIQELQKSKSSGVITPAGRIPLNVH